MAGTFLERFVDRVLAALEANGEIELVEGSRNRAVVEIAEILGTSGQGSQLITSLIKALLASPHVEELFIDDEALMERIDDLGSDWVRQS